ncbi:NlpC/P60 family protein [Clostridium saccharoperbutylacetonicum]|uniref:C40 family peptidase n=1 Tax=Clostridium saccharoperbutylacetonicum TaxID=36745 RepID=UPI0039EBC511
MKRIRRIVVTTTLLLLITYTGNALPAFAEPTDISLEQAIQNIQEDDNQIEYNMDKLNKLKDQITQKESDIKDNEKELEDAQAEVEEKDNQLSERLKGIQLNGGIEATPMQYLDAVFSSGNVLDALKKVNLISEICTRDKKLILKAEESKKQLLDIKDHINKENNELQKNKVEVEKQISDLENQKSNLMKYVQDNTLLLTSDEGVTIPVTLPSDISPKVKTLIEESEKYLKVPYLWGGESPEGFDCSGLMQYVFKSQGIEIPRTSEEQQSFAKPIDTAEIKPGDLVFNKTTDSTHVGMYVGYDMYIQAPHTGDIVKISRLSTSNMKYVGRVLN